MSIDHVVIVVDDLARAGADYRTLGFTVVEGGRHADGVTENVLVAFEDGSYLELVSFIDSPPPEHLFARGEEVGEGLLAYALLPGDIDETISSARHKGLQIKGPRDSGRKRPDGVQISWRLGIADGYDLPFLCADVTQRGLRVPHGPSAQHANGATGVKRVTVAVESLDRSRERYSALLGGVATEKAHEHGVSFRLGGSEVRLVTGEDRGVKNYLERRGEGPYAITLGVDGRGEDTELASTLTHGVRMNLKAGL